MTGIFIGMINRLWDPIVEYVGYLFVDVRWHVNNLVDAVERLRMVEELVGLDPPYPSSEWVRGVRHLRVEADKIKARLNDGWALNYLSKSYYVKQANRVLEEVNEFFETGKQPLEWHAARPRPITYTTDNAQHSTQRRGITDDRLVQTLGMARGARSTSLGRVWPGSDSSSAAALAEEQTRWPEEPRSTSLGRVWPGSDSSSAAALAEEQTRWSEDPLLFQMSRSPFARTEEETGFVAWSLRRWSTAGGARPNTALTDTAEQANKKRRRDSTTGTGRRELSAQQIKKSKVEQLLGTKLLQRGTTTVTDPAKHLSTISRQGMRERERELERTARMLGDLSRFKGMASYAVEVRDFMAASSSSSWLLGISGMRGVGKTTLLRSLRDSYTHSSYFDQVFFVGAGTGCSVDRLQRVLSVYLGLLNSSDNNSNDVPAMAKLISRSLKPKTFLLLLDDVRERLDLAALGLPTPLGHNQKVIFTTRYPDICADMGCGTGNTATIRMKCLAHHDAWSLFMEKVGVDFTHAHPHIRNLADKMVVECRGLPSALCALGRVMSTKRDVKEWRYAYDVLLKSKQTQVDEIQEMDDEGYSHLHQLEDTLQDSLF